MNKSANRILHFIRTETVLFFAMVIALISCIFVPPSLNYVNYIDWDTLALLFALMAVMQGFQKAGVFIFLANSLLKTAKTSKKICVILVFLPFVFSTVITNDVSLITFVPFSITVLQMAGLQKLMVPVTIMQTIAANMGSSLTPMGNPQNLYLYSKSQIGFWELFVLMLPYVVVTAVILFLFIVMKKSERVNQVSVPVQPADYKLISICLISLVICMLGIFKIIPALIIALIIFAVFLVSDKNILTGVDYSLLLTFFAFFIFIGNIKNIEVFRNFLSFAIEGHVKAVAVLTSQIISNVPSALLLSGFTDNWKELIIGCNIGGLGTLIASMASLISYKILVQQYPKFKKQYYIFFSESNFALLIILLIIALII